MVMERNLVKVGNREVKKRYIGNKLIFEDLGDKTEPLSGEEIFTDKSDDSVVHVEIDGKSYQEDEPSPDNPSEIHSLNDFDVVSSVGRKNLLPTTYDLFTHDGGLYGFHKFLDEPEQVIVTIRDRDTSVDMSSVYFGLTKTGYNFTGGRWSMANGNLRIREQLSNSQNYFSYYPNNEETLNKIFQRFYIQIEKGTIATDWTPAPEDVTEDSNHSLIDKINLLLDEPLRSVGDVKDKLFRDSDGLWKIERNVGEATFDGTEEWGVWYKRNTSSIFGVLSRNLEEPMLKTGGLIVSNMFPSMIVNAIDEEGIHAGTEPRLRIRAFYERVGTTPESTDDEKINSFKQWLSNTYTKGVPLTIVYEVEVPTIEILDQELQDKLNNLRSFQDSNYVYTIVNKIDIAPTLHTTFKSKGWYDYYLKTLLK